MYTFSTEHAIQRVLKLMAIPGASCQERLVADAVVSELKSAGVPNDDIVFDRAHTLSPAGGEIGNLIVRIPGTIPGPTILFSAHLDTVPICVGSKPELVNGIVVSSDPQTGLGGDNRSGVAVVLTSAIELMSSGRNHGPLVLCFFVQEEIGLLGSHYLDASLLGPIDFAINFDGGTVEKITVGATGGERMTIRVNGHPAHAGIAPESGVNASTIFAVAVQQLHQQGWLGRVENEFGVGTSNIGVVRGGDATNVVLPLLEIRAEARSHDALMRSRIVEAFRMAFDSAVEKVSAVDGKRGSIAFESRVDYEAFRLAEEAASISIAASAIQSIGRTPYNDVANGGLDANWLYQHGIPAVTLGCGQRKIHTSDEELVISDYLDACQIAIHIASHAVSD